MDLKTFLNELALGLCEKFSNLNCGGCGVIAAIVGKNLSQIVDVSCITFSRYDLGIPSQNIMKRVGIDNIEDPDKWEEAGISFTHIMLKFEVNGIGHLFDINGVTRDVDITAWAKYRRIPGELPLDVICTISEVEFFWNHTFNRDQICHIREFVEQKFRLYIKKLRLH